MKINNLNSINTDALAYMGDSIYEVAVREHLIISGMSNVNKLHKHATKYVRASAQAEVIRSILDELTEEEAAIVRRGRNHKFKTKAKNADPITYKWATAFEALLGYLYLAEEIERMQWAINKAFAVIEGELDE